MLGCPLGGTARVEGLYPDCQRTSQKDTQKLTILLQDLRVQGSAFSRAA